MLLTCNLYKLCAKARSIPGCSTEHYLFMISSFLPSLILMVGNSLHLSLSLDLRLPGENQIKMLRAQRVCQHKIAGEEFYLFEEGEVVGGSELNFV